MTQDKRPPLRIGSSSNIDDDGPLSPFDPQDEVEDDLWFLPGPSEDEEDVPPGSSPLPRAPRRAIFEMREWQEAQDRLSTALADLTQLYGELDLRLRLGAPGLLERLALRESTDLSWWVGDRINGERLSLWQADRVGSTRDPDLALHRAGWAVRRLTSGPPPADAFARFLERPNTGTLPKTADQAVDEMIAYLAPDEGAILDLQQLAAEAADLHPVTQAAILFFAWQLLGPPQTRGIEAAVLASRHAGMMARTKGSGAIFLSLAQGGPGTFRGDGSPERKLRSWITGATQSTLAALLHLEQISAWREKAVMMTADLSGRTPGRLIDCLIRLPHVSTSIVEKETGSSRAAAQRNLGLFTERGLLREVTGQGRYRFWAIKL